MAYAGGRGSFFRLRVGDFPIVSGVFPQGNKREELKPFYPISKQSLPPVLATPLGAEIWLNIKLPNGVVAHTADWLLVRLPTPTMPSRTTCQAKRTPSTCHQQSMAGLKNRKIAIGTRLT